MFPGHTPPAHGIILVSLSKHQRKLPMRSNGRSTVNCRHISQMEGVDPWIHLDDIQHFPLLLLIQSSEIPKLWFLWNPPETTGYRSRHLPPKTMDMIHFWSIHTFFSCPFGILLILPIIIVWQSLKHEYHLFDLHWIIFILYGLHFPLKETQNFAEHFPQPIGTSLNSCLLDRPLSSDGCSFKHFRE